MRRNKTSLNDTLSGDIDLQKVVEQERTPLPYLLPLGAGTGAVEGIASYVTRLAQATTSSPFDLLRYFVTWFMYSGSRRLGKLCPAASSISEKNSIFLSAVAPRLAQALELLTGVRMIGQTHVGKLLRVFSSVNSVKPNRAWCPQCLHLDAVPYDRLAWSLVGVNHCSIHRVPLMDKCPTCSKAQPHLSHNGAAHRCFGCSGQLDVAGRSNPESTHAYGPWVARTVEVFIGQSLDKNFSADAHSLRRGIDQGFESPHIERPRRLAKLLKVAHITARGWVREDIGVSLEMALRISWVYGVELQTLASGTVNARKIRVTRECPWIRLQIRRRQARSISEEEIVNTVRRMRFTAPLIRPTMTLVAQELRIPSWHPIFEERKIRLYIDSVCCRVSRIRSTLRIWQTCNAVRSAVSELIREGRSVTQRNVRERLPKWGVKTGSTRARYARRLLLQIETRIADEDYKVLELRPAPKLIRGFIEFLN